MSARAASAPGAGVLDRLQVLRSAPTPLRGALAATWTPSPRTGVGPLRVPGPGLQPSSHDTTTTRTDPAGSTLARPDFGPKDGVHLIWRHAASVVRRGSVENYGEGMGCARSRPLYQSTAGDLGQLADSRHSSWEGALPYPEDRQPKYRRYGTDTCVRRPSLPDRRRRPRSRKRNHSRARQERSAPLRQVSCGCN